MFSTKAMCLTACAVFLSAGASHAADIIQMPLGSPATSVPIAPEATGFDWTGFYAGVYGVGQSSPVGGQQYGLGVMVGGNVAYDFVLVGGEVAFHALGGAGGTSYVQALGKAGLIVTDDIVAYAAAGYGFDTGAPVEDDLLAGGGLELAVTDDISVRAQYLHGFPITGANSKDQVTLGASFHF